MQGKFVLSRSKSIGFDSSVITTLSRPAYHSSEHFHTLTFIRFKYANGTTVSFALIDTIEGCSSVGAVVAIASYFVVLVAPAHIARYIAVISTVAAIPGFLGSLTVLCFDIVRVVVAMYDTAYFWLVSVVTYSSLIVMLGDVRGSIVAISFIGWHLNLLVDANIRRLRTIARLNCAIALGTAFAALCVAFDFVPSTRNFVLLRLSDDHVIDAQTVVSNGLLTIAAVVVRNIYRHRAHLCSGRDLARRSIVECAACRCQLRFIEQLNQQHIVGPMPNDQLSAAVPSPVAPDQSLIVQLRCVPVLSSVDAKNVVIRGALLVFLRMPSRFRQAFSAFAFMTSSCLILLCGAPPVKSGGNHLQLTFEAVALGLTVLYALSCVALSQRQLAVAVVSTFDYLFPVSQIMLVILSMGDLLDSHGPSFRVLLVVWLWCLWLFSLDALPPIIRRHIGIHNWLIRLVATTLIAALAYAGYLVIKTLAHSSEEPETNRLHNRILWQGELFGRAFSIRLIAVFSNCYATSITWGLRLLWRVWRAGSHDMVVLDGPIEYDNVRHKIKQRTNRRQS
ncbi:hypothetical protein P43SY_002273 [Pythium insidiosum]|uniref:Transmembrane protein n=1 Tax=Pythium insidiosum TaxID=114742 RepID=A0AAD5Q2B3_PYTIN|nr:hypothetical protein P43SY_002273 [Pythium insidiosum]